MRGRLFQPGAEAINVEAHIGGNDLVLTGEGVSLRWPLDSLEARLGGDGSGHLVLGPRANTALGGDAPERPEVYVDRAGLVNELDGQGAPPWFVDQVKGLVGAHRRRWALSRTILLGVVGALLLGLGVVLLTARSLALAAVPPSWETKAGDTFWESHRPKLTLVEDPQLTRFIEETCRRLLATHGKPVPYTFQFHVARDPTVNAFAFPGGHVVVNTGLIAKAGSPDEVAGVLAHELAHVLERHSLESALDRLGITVVLGLLFDPTTALGEVQAALSLLDLKFSRDHEREADAVGLTMLHQAGFDPMAMGRFFDTLAKETVDLSGALNLVSTHPASSERSAELKARASSLPEVPRVQVVSPEAWAELQAKAR